MTEDRYADVERHLDATHDQRIESYREFLRIPSISALPERAADVRRAAEWLAARLGEAGLDHAEVSDTGGHPVVYADHLHAPGAPTVLVYGHYDVQPADPLDLWTSPPFEPVVVDGRMLGRGSADDKGQIHAHLMAAGAINATRDGAFPVNLRYVFEGEEEKSSPNLEPWLRANVARLKADVAIISDTAFFEGNVPAITIGLRGITYVQIDVTGTPVDLHSGGFGGAVPNPAGALATILAALKGADGRILIPGFYDDVIELSAEDRAAMRALPFDDAGFQAEAEIGALVGEAGYTTLERKSIRPTLDVNGMWGGFTGDGPKTIIPAHAHAKVSCRLVAAQDPHDIQEKLRSFIAEVAPPGVQVTVTDLGNGRPTLTSTDHPVTRASARAIEASFGREPVYIRAGGSIPVAANFESILGLPVVLLGFAPPHGNFHAPNEWMDLDNYERSIRTIVRTFDEIAANP